MADDGLVGVTRFELATTRPPDAYSNRAELHPALCISTLDALAIQHLLTCNALLLSPGLQHPLLPALDALAIQHFMTCNALLLSLGLQHPLLPTLATQLRLAMPSTCN